MILFLWNWDSTVNKVMYLSFLLDPKFQLVLKNTRVDSFSLLTKIEGPSRKTDSLQT